MEPARENCEGEGTQDSDLSIHLAAQPPLANSTYSYSYSGRRTACSRGFFFVDYHSPCTSLECDSVWVSLWMDDQGGVLVVSIALHRESPVLVWLCLHWMPQCRTATCASVCAYAGCVPYIDICETLKHPLCFHVMSTRSRLHVLQRA